MQVTVTGGVGHPPATLTYSANDIAYMQAQAFAATIDKDYKTAIYYNPYHAANSPGYLIIPTQYASNLIDAHGFGAIVDENNGKSSSIVGGYAKHGQTVLAGNGGLYYTATGADAGNNTVVAGGGKNWISFSGDKGKDAAYTSTGNDTIIGGDGHTTIAAGSGDNEIFLFKGHSLVESSGRDTISLGAGGADTIAVLPGGRDLVEGSPGYAVKLHFIGGAAASTVLAGAGSYTILGGAGGGVFQGGGSGHNSIVGGGGSVTITAGGAGDTLIAGNGAHNVITAGAGNETLGGGSGSTLFDLSLHTIVGVGASVDKILDFTTKDLLDVGGIKEIDMALSTYHVSHGNGEFLLGDGSKIVLEGYTHPLTISDFKH